MDVTRSVRVPEHVLVRAVDGELVLLNLDNEQYYGLDAIGAAMWDALTTAATLPEAIQELLEAYEVDKETLTQDVEKLLQELNARGLVELDPS